MNKIIVAGGINIDIVATAERHPQLGETCPATGLAFLPGGKGANQAIAAARLGARSLLIGKVGSDRFGDEVIHFLKSQRVDIQNVSRTSAADTGSAVVIVAAGQNIILTIPGANAFLNERDIEAVSLAKDDIVLSQFEIPTDILRGLLLKAKAAGAKVILNPSPSKAEAEHLLQLADILIVNQSELAFLLRQRNIKGNSLKSACRELKSKQEQVIIVTLGESGAFASSEHEELHMSGRKIEAIDPTGAGDCFAGALAAKLIEGSRLDQALNYANVAASISAERIGASTSMPTVSEVNKIQLG